MFEPLTLDLDDLASVADAAAVLADRGGRIDVLLLNAGIAPPRDVTKTTDGTEATAAATLTGHHLLTTRLIHAGVLSNHARIIIAGSEAARGDFPTFTPIDIDDLATENFGGDHETAIEAVIRIQPPVRYRPNNQYATVKMLTVWWAAELAGKLPAGMTSTSCHPAALPAQTAPATPRSS